MLHLQNLTLMGHADLEASGLDVEWLARAKQLVLERGPTLFTGLLIVLGGWLAAKIVRAVLRRVLTALRLDRALSGTRLATVIGALGEGFGPAQLLAALAYYTVLLIALDTAAGQLGLVGIQRALSGAVSYLPKVFRRSRCSPSARTSRRPPKKASARSCASCAILSQGWRRQRPSSVRYSSSRCCHSRCWESTSRSSPAT